MADSVNIKYIAKLANVSPATVSRVINRKVGVAKLTQDRILELVEWVGYKPNLLARGLVGKKFNGIALVIPRTSQFVFSNPFYPEVLKAIGELANQYQYHLLLSFAGEDSYASTYRYGVARGVIVISNRLYDPKIDELAKERIPTVLVPGLLDHATFPSVDVDNMDGGFQAAQHLISLGHKRIAFLGGAKDSKYHIERLAGYERAFEKNRISVEKDLIVETDFSQLQSFDAMENLLRLREPPTAVVCVNDVTAFGALLAINKNHLNVPDHLSLVGFGDTPLAAIVNPPLTTVKEPIFDIGASAVTMLNDLINGHQRANYDIVLPVKLVVRSSTKGISGK
jgi:LacI family transcriptional regulator